MELDSNFSDEQVEETEEEKQAREENEMKLKEESLKTFIDRPDEVKDVWVDYCDDHSIDIMWKEPECNNSPITRYHIYLSQLTIKRASQPSFVFTYDKFDEFQEQPK